MSEPAQAADGAARFERVLGVNFFCGSAEAACARAAVGGLVTAPSGPGLAGDLVSDAAYQSALLESDTVLTDSAFMVGLWWLRTGRRLPRTSGLAFMNAWLWRDEMRRPGAVVWVMPTAAEARHTRRWLAAHGFPADEGNFFVAPHYAPGPVDDPALLAFVEARRPAVVYFAIGGGVQERVGHFLRRRLSYRPAILCLGAALAFITGAQTNIPAFADRFGLGWLWRVASDPRRYGGRYWRAARLAGLVLRYGAELPPVRR
ncbi:MAG: hypothetical protein RLZZ15_4517 [Verrucomicrobiota bacterium]|jgi:UDP-N-acetyl-D-mannosaminuronic acid transferase (WecB/TagA/CpsF family)